MIPWEFRVTQEDGLNLTSDRGDKRGWGWLGGFQFNEIARPPQPTIRKEGPAGFGGRGFWGQIWGQICKGCPAGSCTLGQHSPCTCVFVELYLNGCIFVLVNYML